MRINKKEKKLINILTKPKEKRQLLNDEIRFIKGRLKFDDHENSAPFPSAIVIFSN